MSSLNKLIEEINSIKRAERKLEVDQHIQKIGHEFKKMKEFMEEDAVKKVLPDIKTEFTIHTDGLSFAGWKIRIKEGKNITITHKGKKITSESKTLQAISKKITKMSKAWQKRVKHKIAKRKKQLLEELKNF